MHNFSSLGIANNRVRNTARAYAADDVQRLRLKSFFVITVAVDIDLVSVKIKPCDSSFHCVQIAKQGEVRNAKRLAPYDSCNARTEAVADTTVAVHDCLVLVLVHLPRFASVRSAT